MNKNKFGDYIEKSRRSCADLRIQSRDDFKEIVKHERYNKYCSAQESSIFRRFVHKSLGKIIGKAMLIIGGETQNAENKGYPLGFTNYQTYDKRHNDNYRRSRSRKRNKTN